MINISANIAGHALMLWSPVALPTGSIAVDQLELAQVVGEEWAACATVTAQFWIKPTEIYEVEFENNVAVIPQEVLSEVGLLHIAVYGSDAAGTKRISTNTITMPITQGSFTEAGAPAPTPSLFEQALEAAIDQIDNVGAANAGSFMWVEKDGTVSPVQICMPEIDDYLAIKRKLILQQGGINSNGTDDSGSSTRVRFARPVYSAFTVTVNTGYIIRGIARYNSSGAFLDLVLPTVNSEYTSTGEYGIRLMFASAASLSTHISPADDIIASISVTGSADRLGANITANTERIAKLEDDVAADLVHIVEQGAINSDNTGTNYEPTSSFNAKRTRFARPVHGPFRVAMKDGYAISGAFFYDNDTGAFVDQLTVPQPGSRFSSRFDFTSSGEYSVRLLFAHFANGIVNEAISPTDDIFIAASRTTPAYVLYSNMPSAYARQEVITKQGHLYSDGRCWRQTADNRLAVTASGYRTVRYSDMSRISGLNDAASKPAHSMTKVLTAYIALAKNEDANSEFSLDAEYEIVSADIDSSSSDCVQAGDVFTGEDLLNAAIIASDNNAAEALGRVIIQADSPGTSASAARTAFCALMQTVAGSLGMSNTSNFVSPHGQMQSTPEDMCKLFKAICGIASTGRASKFEEIAAKTSYTMTSQASSPRASYTIYSTTDAAARALIPEYAAGKTGTGGTGASSNAAYGFIWDDPASGDRYITVLMDTIPAERFKNARQMVDEVYAINNGNAPSTEPDAAEGGTPQITISSGGTVSQKLAPNTLYVFTGAVTSLTLTLGIPIPGIASVYRAVFSNGSTPVNLNLPNTVKAGGFAAEANKITLIEILYTGIGDTPFVLEGRNI